MKKYIVTYKKDFCILAQNEADARATAINLCADDPELLLPHNMEETIEESNLPDSFFFE